MAKQIDIIIENKLTVEKRPMNVYHHATRSAHMIGYNGSITLPLKPAVEDDYLHISIVSGPGRLKTHSVVNLPSWSDFEFSFDGNVTLVHSGDRTLIKLPPGPPGWQLKMTRSGSSFSYRLSDRITVGDG